MNNINYNNSSESFDPKQENNEIEIKDIWKSILRKRKWFLLTTGLIFSGSILFTINSRIFNPVFQGSFSLLILDPMSPRNVDKNPYNSSSTLFQQIASNANEYEINTLITLLRSPIFLEPIAKQFNISADSLKNKIKINQATIANKRTKGILNVYLNYENTKIGKSILDELSKSYLKASLDQKQRRLNDGLNFLNNQSPEILKKKNELQSKLVKFREKYRFLKPLEEGRKIKQKQNDLENKILILNEERDRLKDIRKGIENGSLTAGGFQKKLNDGLFISDFDQGLLKELIKLENQLASAKSKFTPNSRVINGLNQRLKLIKPALFRSQLDAVDAALSLNQGSIASMVNLNNELDQKFLAKPQLIRKYQDIERELQLANENLLSLISAKESLQLEIAQNNIPWRLISLPKMGRKPVKPDFKKNLFTGLIGGIFAGTILALIRDRLDNVFHYPEDVAKGLDIPVLVNLPHVVAFKTVREESSSILELLNSNTYKKEDGQIDSYQRFFYQEAFRNLCTSIRFIDANQQIKTIILTSSLPKEGKTLTNILLAKTLSDQGLRVLLIDADMRKPQIHVRLDLNNLIGLSNILIDPNISFNQAINKVKGYENWSVITGGTLPPDPTRLLGSKRFKEVINTLKNNGEYDIILIDSPPILGLADSLLISGNADGVIVLVGIEVVDRSLPKESINKMKSVGANIYGLVTNQTRKSVDALSQNYGYSKYGGYKYEYGGYGNPYQPLSTYQNYGDEKVLDKESKKQDLEPIDKNDMIKIGKMNIEFKGVFIVLNQKVKKFMKWLEN